MQGQLKGYDQLFNLVLDNVEELDEGRLQSSHSVVGNPIDPKELFQLQIK